MAIPPNDSKLQQDLQIFLIQLIKNVKSKLLASDLYQAEVDLHKGLADLANLILTPIMEYVASEQIVADTAVMKQAGATKVEVRTCKILTITGHPVEVKSLYAISTLANWKGSRHSILRKWNIISGASPRLAEQVAFASTISPSYDLGNQLIRRIGVSLCTTTQRKITNAFARHCKDMGDVELVLDSDETLAQKRVILSIDGGRTKTRSEREVDLDTGLVTYATQWKEPKLFVIDIMDSQGKTDRKELPIYGTRFDEAAVCELLRVTLKKLEVEKASEVQLIADGAQWIWQKLPEMLDELGVKKEKITETLDYYHAVEHLHELHATLPKKLGKQVLAKKLDQYKDWLWKGQITLIEQDYLIHCPIPKKEATREINYFKKHEKRTQYADFKALKLMIGSGIVESAVRRVINLRYKNNATFWNQDHVEALYLLRGAMVSKRWEHVISNLFTA